LPFSPTASIISSMSQPFKLYRLQQIDSQLDRGRARLREIEISLSDHATLNQARQRAEATEDKLQETVKKLRRAEQEVQAQRIKIEQTEASLYGGKVRNPKELQDLQNESAALKRYLTVLEDRQLEAMLELEEAENENEEASAVLEKVQAEVSREKSILIEEQTNLLRDIDRQENERQAAASNIPAEDLSLYDQLRRIRSGVAVAKVSDKACMACGSTLSAALLSAALNPNQITRCANCGRILYAG
jgi:uncharacterized protein